MGDTVCPVLVYSDTDRGRNYKYEDVNVTAAQSIASIATETGVSRLIHVSHLNASPNSPSEFYRSKYHGERVVRDAFPEATIVRPGPLFGSEDWLLNAMARELFESRYHRRS